MKRAFCIVCLLLAALLTVGCAAKTDAAESEPAVTATPASTAAPTPEPTAVPTQMPLLPLSADAFSALTAKEAAAQIRAAFSQYPCYNADYSIGTYADYVSYDEAHDSVRIRLASGTDAALLRAILPLTETGRLTRLMVELEPDAEVAEPLRGVQELILASLDSDDYEWLSACTDVVSLTVCDVQLNESIAYPPMLQTLTVEDDDVPLSTLLGEPEENRLPELTTLNIGTEENEELTVDCGDDTFASLPKLTTLNLWLAPGEDANRIYRQALSLTTLQTLNGLVKGAYGAYYGLGVTEVMDTLSEMASSAADEGGSVSATSGLPSDMKGTIYVRIASETSTNLEGDGYVISDSMDADPGEFYGIPTALLWRDGMPQRHVWAVYIYETDEIVGYYGDAEDEIWGYAVDTCVLTVDTYTGRIFKASVKRTNPPATNADDTYGDYCPLTAVEQVRARMKSTIGPYAGCTLEEAVSAAENNLENTGKTFATEGLPAAITGPLYVEVSSGDGNLADEDDVDSTSYATEGLDYYGIPYGRIYQDGSLESTAWVAVIVERDVESRTYGEEAYYTEGYTVETHLIIIDLSTGNAWHRLVSSSQPPSNPEETNYGSFFPNKAVALLKPLVK